MIIHFLIFFSVSTKIYIFCCKVKNYFEKKITHDFSLKPTKMLFNHVKSPITYSINMLRLQIQEANFVTYCLLLSLFPFHCCLLNSRLPTVPVPHKQNLWRWCKKKKVVSFLLLFLKLLLLWLPCSLDDAVRLTTASNRMWLFFL